MEEELPRRPLRPLRRRRWAWGPQVAVMTSSWTLQKIGYSPIHRTVAVCIPAVTRDCNCSVGKVFFFLGVEGTGFCPRLRLTPRTRLPEDCIPGRLRYCAARCRNSYCSPAACPHRRKTTQSPLTGRTARLATLRAAHNGHTTPSGSQTQAAVAGRFLLSFFHE